MSLPELFHGYPRATGRAGVRNHLLILSACSLNRPHARKLAASLPEAVLLASACGRGQVGADRDFHDSVLRQMAGHPNTGAVLVLAPDKGLRETFQAAAEAAGRPVAGFSLQEAGEDAEAMLSDAVDAGRALLRDLSEQTRQPCPVSDLVLAVECGHSDASSGMVANPLAGDLCDALIAAGGAALFSETIEWLGAEHVLAPRCAAPETEARLRAFLAARQAHARAQGKDLRLGNPGPQNHDGGITTLEEKSLGAIRKGGTSPIMGALDQGAPIPGPGLYLMDTPALSPESITSMVAGGAQLVCFTTGHGNPYGSALAPTLKMSANPETVRRLPRQIDFDASPAFTGARPRTELLPDLAARLLQICEGAPTWAETTEECDEVISRLGPSI
ncbi:UxaA family hydrolase [Halovulum sp. GXIMD14794]